MITPPTNAYQHTVSATAGNNELDFGAPYFYVWIKGGISETGTADISVAPPIAATSPNWGLVDNIDLSATWTRVSPDFPAQYLKITNATTGKKIDIAWYGKAMLSKV